MSFFGLTESKDKKEFALFMEPFMINIELFFKYKLDPSTRMITEEVKELALDPCILNLLQKVVEFVFIAFVVMFEYFIIVSVILIQIDLLRWWILLFILERHDY